MSAKATGELLREAKAGNGVARRQLLLRHHVSLLAQVRTDLSARLRAYLDPEDVLQEVYLAALDGLDSFRGDGPDELCHWLHTIARNKVAEVHRRFLDTGKRDVRHERHSYAGPLSHTAASLSAALQAHMTTAAGCAVRQEGLDALAAALAVLPTHYREVLELRYLQGLSVEETAGRMGRTRGSVLMMTHRAMAQVAATIKEFPLLTRG